ncbi:hypothetical protein MSPP1_000470 [Malassezia sp. CBS 17886]|nr:hypothetical protein MSPP1_000470 [Malassezia sp. CBS 17886]
MALVRRLLRISARRFAPRTPACARTFTDVSVQGARGLDGRVDSAEAGAQPTLETLDALRPRTRQQRRTPSPAAAAAQATHAQEAWDATARGVADSFTRPQLLVLARGAGLKGVKSSHTKAQIVHAILTQRFQLADPDTPDSSGTQFVQLGPRDVFLLAPHGASFLGAARDAGARVVVTSRNKTPGVFISGTPSAVERVRSWLSAFLQRVRVRTVEVPQGLVPPPQGFVPPPRESVSPRQGLVPPPLQTIAQHTQCYVREIDAGKALGGPTYELSYLEEHHAHAAAILLSQGAAANQVDVHRLWCYADSTRMSVVPLRHPSPPDAAFAFFRWAHMDDQMHAAESSPLRMLQPLADTPAESDLAQMLLTELSGVDDALPPDLVAGPCTRALHLSFGHLLYPAQEANDLTARTLQEAAAAAYATPRFVPAEAPSCVARTPTLVAYGAKTRSTRELHRLEYEGMSAAGRVVLHIDMRPRETGGGDILAARWVFRVEAHIACPDAPLDACLAATSAAPAAPAPLAAALRAFAEQRPAGEEGGACASPTVPPLRLVLPGNVALRLRNVSDVSEAVTVLEPSHAGELGAVRLTRAAVRDTGARGFARRAEFTWETWPSAAAYGAVLDELLHAPFRSLGLGISDADGLLQSCSGMWAGKSTSINVVFYPKSQGQVATIVYNVRELESIGKVEGSRDMYGLAHLTYVCDNAAVQAGLCAAEQIGMFIVNDYNGAPQTIVQQRFDFGAGKASAKQLTYNVTETGYYCVGTAWLHGKPAGATRFEGHVEFRNVFRGNLPAAEHPKLYFYAALALLYMVLGAGWLYLCYEHRDQIVAVQHFVSGTVAFLIVEMLCQLYYYSYYNSHRIDFVRIRSIDGRASETLMARFLLVLINVLDAARNSLSLFLLLIVAMGYGVVRPTIGSEMTKVRVLTGLHFLFGVLYSVGIVLIFMDDASAWMLLFIFPLAFTLTMFLMWILYALKGSIMHLTERRQTYKCAMFTKLYRILQGAVAALFIYFFLTTFVIFTNGADGLVTNLWQYRWLLLDGSLGFLYFAVFASIAWVWRPTGQNMRLAMSDEVATDEEAAAGQYEVHTLGGDDDDDDDGNLDADAVEVESAHLHHLSDKASAKPSTAAAPSAEEIFDADSPSDGEHRQSRHLSYDRDASEAERERLRLSDTEE